MVRALDMFIVEGISTSIPIHEKIMADPDFRAGRFDTQFLARFSLNGRGSAVMQGAGSAGSGS